MVVHAHSRTFAFFDGVPARLIYDNLKTAVDAAFVGKERQFNRRFLTLANHYLFEPSPLHPPPVGGADNWRIKWAMWGSVLPNF
jgi:transposase